MRRVLVAGATGYLGHHLVARLKEEGYWIRVLVRRSEQADRMLDADEVFVGQVTDEGSLRGVAEGIDTVFSSVGITRQRDGVGYQQVDFAGNLALLREAEHAGVERFLYVSILHGEELSKAGVRLAMAKERFVAALAASPVAHTIVRPPGYFSDMTAFLDMAAKGTVYLVGSGDRRMNPISGRDLASACVAAAAAGITEVEVGGPDALSHTEIARAAFAAVGKLPRIRHLPQGLAGVVGRIVRIATPERVYGPLQFFLAVMSTDMVAPLNGTDHLAGFFQQECDRKNSAAKTV